MAAEKTSQRTRRKKSGAAVGHGKTPAGKENTVAKGKRPYVKSDDSPAKAVAAAPGGGKVFGRYQIDHVFLFGLGIVVTVFVGYVTVGPLSDKRYAVAEKTPEPTAERPAVENTRTPTSEADTEPTAEPQMTDAGQDSVADTEATVDASTGTDETETVDESAATDGEAEQGETGAAEPDAETTAESAEPDIARFFSGRDLATRPETAARITAFGKDAIWYRQALSGLAPPYPASFRFLEDQGAWYTPFARAGMTGPYDIRGFHANPGAERSNN